MGGRWFENVFKDVLYVLGANLFSVRSATKRGFTVSFIGDQVRILHGKKTVLTGTSFPDGIRVRWAMANAPDVLIEMENID